MIIGWNSSPEEWKKRVSRFQGGDPDETAEKLRLMDSAEAITDLQAMLAELPPPEAKKRLLQMLEELPRDTLDPTQPKPEAGSGEPRRT